jgi:hypothetical protein
LCANWLISKLTYTIGVAFSVSAFRVSIAFIVWRTISRNIDAVLADLYFLACAPCVKFCFHAFPCLFLCLPLVASFPSRSRTFADCLGLGIGRSSALRNRALNLLLLPNTLRGNCNLRISLSHSLPVLTVCKQFSLVSPVLLPVSRCGEYVSNFLYLCLRYVSIW